MGWKTRTKLKSSDNKIIKKNQSWRFKERKEAKHRKASEAAAVKQNKNIFDFWIARNGWDRSSANINCRKVGCYSQLIKVYIEPAQTWTIKSFSKLGQ
jgi:hypothetical protein